MDDILGELGFGQLNSDLLSDDERKTLQRLCDDYQLSETELDKNDYKRKIIKLLKSYDISN